jgi:hypothetical protein
MAARPEPSEAARAWVAAYRRERERRPLDDAVVVETPSGLSHADIHAIIVDRGLSPRFFDMLADFVRPERGVYFDALHGAHATQRGVRRFLAEVMSEAADTRFEAVFPPQLFTDAHGSVSVEEWEAFPPGATAPALKGISIRRLSGPWIDYAADYYDTMPLRRAAAKAGRALPEWPREAPDVWDDRPSAPLSAAARDWLARRRAVRAAGGWDVTRTVEEPSGLSARDMHAIMNDRSTERDFDVICDLMHPTEALYVDPIFGTFRGQARIRGWLTDIMGKVGKATYVAQGAALLADGVSFQEWRQVAPLPGGGEIVMSRGASVRRFADGWMTYAADYFDTAPMYDPEVQAASKAAGSTVTAEDVLRYLKPSS